MKYLPIARPKLVPNQKRLEFIEIPPNWYFKYADFDFDVKYNFYETFIAC